MLRIGWGGGVARTEAPPPSSGRTHPGVLHPPPNLHPRFGLLEGPTGAEERRVAVGAEREGSGREGGSGVGGAFSASSGPPILERRLGWTWGALEGTGVWGETAFFSSGGPGLWRGAELVQSGLPE